MDLSQKRAPINGKRLQRLRKEAGFTQDEMANKLDITRETVNKIENNKAGTIQTVEHMLIERWWHECSARLTAETQTSFIQYIVERFTKRA